MSQGNFCDKCRHYQDWHKNGVCHICGCDSYVEANEKLQMSDESRDLIRGIMESYDSRVQEELKAFGHNF